jgi:hypothetical protein
MLIIRASCPLFRVAASGYRCRFRYRSDAREVSPSATTIAAQFMLFGMMLLHLLHAVLCAVMTAAPRCYVSLRPLKAVREFSTALASAEPVCNSARRSGRSWAAQLAAHVSTRRDYIHNRPFARNGRWGMNACQKITVMWLYFVPNAEDVPQPCALLPYSAVSADYSPFLISLAQLYIAYTCTVY